MFFSLCEHVPEPRHPWHPLPYSLARMAEPLGASECGEWMRRRGWPQTSLAPASFLLRGKSSWSAGSSNNQCSSHRTSAGGTSALCLLSLLQGLRFNKPGHFYCIVVSATSVWWHGMQWRPAQFQDTDIHAETPAAAPTIKLAFALSEKKAASLRITMKIAFDLVDPLKGWSGCQGSVCRLYCEKSWKK